MDDSLTIDKAQLRRLIRMLREHGISEEEFFETIGPGCWRKYHPGQKGNHREG